MRSSLRLRICPPIIARCRIPLLLLAIAVSPLSATGQTGDHTTPRFAYRENSGLLKRERSTLWDPSRLIRDPGLVPRDLKQAGVWFVADAVHIYTAPLRINARSALWLGGVAVTAGLIYAYDQEIFDALNRNRDCGLYKFFRKSGEAVAPVGHMGITNRYYFAGLGLSYILGFQPGVTLLAQILEAHFISGAGKNLSGVLVGRRRPHEDMGPRSFARSEGTSFPSGHAINIMELATILSRHFPFLPFQITCYYLATAVCFQRVTDHQHWPSDVFAGAVFGAVVADALLDLHAARGVHIRPLIPDGNHGLGCVLTIDL